MGRGWDDEQSEGRVRSSERDGASDGEKRAKKMVIETDVWVPLNSLWVPC
jgi:hypothetical protein